MYKTPPLKKQFSKTALTVSLALLISLSASAVRAVTLGQVDDFQNGTTQGWGGSFTFNIADAGPNGVGDNALRVNSNNRVVIINSTQWVGDYTAAGITQVLIDIRHDSAFPLEMRLGIAQGVFGKDGIGDTYVSAESISVPGDNAWHSITIPILAADLVPSFANTSDPPDAAVALAGLTHLRILHNPDPNDFRGAQGTVEFFLDNIQVVSDTGDFDNDGDVDGADFLTWQRNTGVGSLADWESSFGSTGSLAAAHAVPEPAAWLLMLASALFGLLLRKPRLAM